MGFIFLNMYVLKNTKVKLKVYTVNQLGVVGVCNSCCYKNKKLYNLDFYIVNSKTKAILGLPSCKFCLVVHVDFISKLNDNQIDQI